MQEVTVEELTKGKKVSCYCPYSAWLAPTAVRHEHHHPQVVFFAVPGAFTPTCSSKHLPGFIEKADEIKAKGVDTIACVAVNDAFVMDAWGKSAGIDDKIMMLADGSADFAKVCCSLPSNLINCKIPHSL